ncbi:MAG: OmpH family outer membrane protein [Nevskiaceae bacterium]
MRTTVSVLAAALVAATVAAPAAAETKIGVIRTQVLMQPQLASANAKMKGEFQKREDELKAEAKKLDEDEKRLQREGDIMSVQQRANLSKDLYTRKTDFELKQRQFAEEVQSRNNQLNRELIDKLGRAIEAVAHEQGLDLVVQDPAYNAKALDVTEAVMAKIATLADAPAPAKNAPKKKK